MKTYLCWLMAQQQDNRLLWLTWLAKYAAEDSLMMTRPRSY